MSDLVALGVPRSSDAIAAFAAWTWFGLLDIHAKGIAHRDFGPHNLFAEQIGDGWNIRAPLIIDFGYSFHNDIPLLDAAGQPIRSTRRYADTRWQAPSTADPSKSTFETERPIDIYHWALNIYYLATGQPAFPSEGPHPSPLQEWLAGGSSAQKLLNELPLEQLGELLGSAVRIGLSWHPSERDESAITALMTKLATELPVQDQLGLSNLRAKPSAYQGGSSNPDDRPTPAGSVTRPLDQPARGLPIKPFAIATLACLLLFTTWTWAKRRSEPTDLGAGKPSPTSMQPTTQTTAPNRPATTTTTDTTTPTTETLKATTSAKIVVSVAPTTPGPTVPPTTAAPTPTVVQAIPLSGLKLVKGPSVNTNPVSMNGTEYTNALRTNRHPFSTYRDEFNLSGSYSRLEGLVGFSDPSSTKYKWELRAVSLENGAERQLFQVFLSDGQTAPIDVSVEGVTRFEISIRLAQQQPLSAGPSTDYPAVWAATLKP